VATQSDVRKIALSLDGVSESADDFRFFSGDKQFIWLWQERVDPKKPRVPNKDVIVVRTAGDIEKQVLLAMNKAVFFTEPHYAGYPAVLVRLPKIGLPMLRDVITQGWTAVGTARSRSRTGPRARPASRRAR
jgi:hypothetical protein